MFTMTPKEIVSKLNKYVIGQDEAKKIIAVALRNRWRRMQINKSIRNQIRPKNILMIGPTGVGKTEIARRLAELTNSPFIKVEATKFTEVGYVGKEVDSIIKDLIEITIKNVKQKYIKKFKLKIKKIVEDIILNALINLENNKNNVLIEKNIKNLDSNIIKKKLINGLLENEEIEINLNPSVLGFELISSNNTDDINNQIQSILKNIYKNNKKLNRIKVKDARKILLEEEFNKIIDMDEIKTKSIELIEQNGIVFIDEIDKICRKRNELYGLDVSREGVQRDLLSLIDGCSVFTKYGSIKTENILFIASGAFYNVDPSDLMPELQGRLPIKVKLKNLSINDFEKILINPENSISNHYKKLIATEGVNINFTNCAIKEIAYIAWKINENKENIGARRLYSILEKLMEDISFYASDIKEKEILVNKIYVNKHLREENYNNKDKFIL